MDKASLLQLAQGDEAKATVIGELLDGTRTIDKYDVPDEFPGTQSWVNQCYHYPSDDEILRSALNDLIGGFGVEALNHPDDSSQCIALYINTGDTYHLTIVYDVEKDEYVATTWGDWYEGWLAEQNEENDTVQCGWCSHLTPMENTDEDREANGIPDDEVEWSWVICEQCGNYVDGKPGPNRNASGHPLES